MSTMVMDQRPTVGAAAIGQAPSILSSILKPTVQLVLWQRLRPDTLGWIDALDWTEIDDINSEVTGPEWSIGIAALLSEAGYPQSAAGNALTRELSERAAAFAALLKCDRLNLRLEVIETDACRKFHMDSVTARLLMPLHGPGTQWIDTTLGEDAPVNQLTPGDVAIFKGRRAVEVPTILHRSPPIATTGETRLLLALTPSEDKDHSGHDV